MESGNPDSGTRSPAGAGSDLNARLCVVEQRVNDHEHAHDREDAKRDARITALEEKLGSLDKDLEVFKARVAAYAGLGAVAGSILVNVASEWVSKVIRIP